MALVDHRGRLFGRFNLVDCVLLVLFLVLLPTAYGAWLLFRTPPGRLMDVEPKQVTAAPSFRVVVQGQDLRPYMRISLGGYQGFNFLYVSSTTAEVEFRGVPMGVYDVILYDYEKERGRLPQAVKVAASPIPDTKVMVVGTLGNLTEQQMADVKPGWAIGGFGEVVEVGRPAKPSTRVFAGQTVVNVQDPPGVRLPVAIRTGCTLRSREGHPVCSVIDVDVQPGALFMLSTSLGQLTFQVDQVRTTLPVEDVRVTVRFASEARIVSQIHEGDLDVAKVINELSAGATVVSVSSPRPELRETVLRVPAQRESAGWIYHGEPLRVGTPFALRTAGYEVSGLIVAIEPQPSSTPASR